MIIGSGLLANAFLHSFSQREDVLIYAAGVSNSGCTDLSEFEREKKLLEAALKRLKRNDTFVYFGTCSVFDPDAFNTPYVQHKLNMENTVREKFGSLIFRLPQVAGFTSNQYTLLNFLYSRISQGESFNLWRYAKRNIIDVDDVAAIATRLINNSKFRNITCNIANQRNYPMTEIVSNIEKVVGKNAVYQIVDRGSESIIDTSMIFPILELSNVKFNSDYLEKVVMKYYKNVTK